MTLLMAVAHNAAFDQVEGIEVRAAAVLQDRFA
jgi:hypothetical protein